MPTNEPNRWILIRPSDGALIDASYTPSNGRWNFQGPGDIDVPATIRLIADMPGTNFSATISLADGTTVPYC